MRGMASYLSPGSRVKSPTYTIVNEYLRGDVPVYHFDFYRISSPEELDGIGFDEYADGGICIVEWSSLAASAIPESAAHVTIDKTGEGTRLITVSIPEVI